MILVYLAVDVLTFEFVDEIRWCHYSDETSLPVLSHCTIH